MKTDRVVAHVRAPREMLSTQLTALERAGAEVESRPQIGAPGATIVHISFPIDGQTKHDVLSILGGWARAFPDTIDIEFVEPFDVPPVI